jgi:hypothetical protein
MPKSNKQKSYSCRVNILKYVKIGGKWRFAPAQTQNNSRPIGPSWMAIRNAILKVLTTSNGYENGIRRLSIKDSD